MLMVSAASGWFVIRFWPDRELVLGTQLLRTTLSRAGLYAQTGKLGTDWGVTQDAGNIVLFSGTAFADRDPSHDEILPLPQGVIMSGLNETIFTAPQGMTTSRTISVSRHDKTISLSVNKYGVTTFHE